MINLVELIDEGKDAPCIHGNIVEGHACYCHHKDGPRKCPIFRYYGEGDLQEWNTNNCDLFDTGD